MAKRAKENDTAISTFIGADADIKGRISFEGTIRVDGKVEGEILSATGTLIVGEGAATQGEISVDKAIVMGTVDGSLVAQQQIELYKPAQVTGDIQAPVISIDAGVTFNGKCTMSAKTISETESDEGTVEVVSSTLDEH